MVDILRKHVAPAHRILVDATAFLNPEFADAVLYFTGAHIELMRNLVDYANRRTTFVSDYYIGYYLSPTDADWNLIQAIVADLEGTLMGNNNVIWGYTDQYTEEIPDLNMPAGNSDKLGDVVPEGEVWEVTGMSARVTSATCSRIRVGMKKSLDEIHIYDKISPTTLVTVSFPMDLILKEGWQLFWRFYGMTLNDNVNCYAWGSKMEVPTA